jgi:hypothetical protein
MPLARPESGVIGRLQQLAAVVSQGLLKIRIGSRVSGRILRRLHGSFCVAEQGFLSRLSSGFYALLSGRESPQTAVFRVFCAPQQRKNFCRPVLECRAGSCQRGPGATVSRSSRAGCRKRRRFIFLRQNFAAKGTAGVPACSHDTGGRKMLSPQRNKTTFSRGNGQFNAVRLSVLSCFFCIEKMRGIFICAAGAMQVSDV